MDNKEKAFKIAQGLVDNDLVKGWQITEKAEESQIPQNLLAYCCHILIANKRKQEQEEQEIFEELRIDAPDPFTKEPEELVSEVVVFPNVNYNIGE